MENVKTGKRTAKYSLLQMCSAMNAVKNQGSSVTGAARKYNVPRATLQTRISGACDINCKRGPRPVLPDYVETELETFCLQVAERGFILKPMDLRLAAADIIKQSNIAKLFKNGIPSPTWVYRFLRRYPLLITAKKLEHGSASVTKNSLEAWYKNLFKFIKLHNLQESFADARRVCNLEETVFYLNDIKGQFIERKSECLQSPASTKENNNISVSVNFSAAGKMYPPLVVLKRNAFIPNIKQCVPPGMVLQRSITGWMKSTTFLLYLKKIKKYLVSEGLLNPRDNKQKVFMFVNGHSSHLSYNTYKLCERFGIILYCLYPNATNVQQPVDIGVMNSLKTKWSREMQKHRQQHPTTAITPQVFPIMAMNAIKGVSKNVLVKAFETCGLCPFDPTRIDYSKLLFTHQSQFNQLLALRVMEDYINGETLAMFRAKRTQVDFKPHMNDCSLFKVWKSIYAAAYEEDEPTSTLLDSDPSHNKKEEANDAASEADPLCTYPEADPLCTSPEPGQSMSSHSKEAGQVCELETDESLSSFLSDVEPFSATQDDVGIISSLQAVDTSLNPILHRSQVMNTIELPVAKNPLNKRKRRLENHFSNENHTNCLKNKENGDDDQRCSFCHGPFSEEGHTSNTCACRMDHVDQLLLPNQIKVEPEVMQQKDATNPTKPCIQVKKNGETEYQFIIPEDVAEQCVKHEEDVKTPLIMSEISETTKCYTCQVCDATFDTERKRNYHISSKHKDIQQIFQCNICFKQFTIKARLKSHYKLVHSNKFYLCEHCHLTTRYKKQLRIHLLRVHLLQKRARGDTIILHDCTKCDKAFQTIDNLKRHNIQKHPYETMKCAICNIIFYSYEKYDKHRITCHRVKFVRTIRCKLCMLSCTSHADLQVHKELKHGIGLQCEYCPCTFTSKQELEKHIFLHIKPSLKCKSCDQIFESNEELENHNIEHVVTLKRVDKSVEIPKVIKFKKYIKIF